MNIAKDFSKKSNLLFKGIFILHSSAIVTLFLGIAAPVLAEITKLNEFNIQLNKRLFVNHCK